MYNRIKEIRKHFGLNQTQFGERIGVKQTTVAGYEMGSRIPLDTVVNSICREFNVNEGWLRTGEGEMLRPVSRDEELAEFFGEISFGDNGSFKKRLISVLARLDESQWDLLEKMATNLVNEIKKTDQ